MIAFVAFVAIFAGATLEAWLWQRKLRRWHEQWIVLMRKSAQAAERYRLHAGHEELAQLHLVHTIEMAARASAVEAILKWRLNSLSSWEFKGVKNAETETP